MKKLLFNHIHTSIFITVFLCNICHALHTVGVWYTQDEFFHFITKFGFQKTDQHQRQLTEGYIYGNITSMSNHSKVYATLALLPKQYFISFYKNRTMSVFDSPDKVCQIMFKEIEKEAYDGKCHDTGREDFLRKVPCQKNKLCIDEDNPSNVIPSMQLTFAIQDINNPRFWYLSLVACRRNSSCGWEYVREPLAIHYDLFVVNGRPFSSQNNIFEFHFSFENQDTVELYLFCLLFYSCILVPVQLYATFKQIHPISRLFSATLITQLTGLVLDTMHLLIFSLNGIGIEALNILGDLFNTAAQSLFMMLLLLLARGWAITRMILTRKHLLIILWLSYTILIFVLYFWNKTEVDVIEDIDEYQTWPGWLTLICRVIIMFWFLFELRNTMKHEHNTAKLQFFLQFGAATLVWFIYMPIMALIALQIFPLWRYKVILGFSYCADLLAHSFMAYMLWPGRSHQYLLLADEVDLSEEMEAFDEAPHVLNHAGSEIELLSLIPETSSTESLTITI